MSERLRFGCCGVLLGLAVSQMYSLEGSSTRTQNVGDEQKKCDYTYVQDSGAPNIGKNGQVHYDESWTPVVESGWILKATVGGGSTAVYVFEKCR